VQEEDVAICDAVQRGLASRAYVAGRLSVRREAGEHLFHRLLHADLTKALNKPRSGRLSEARLVVELTLFEVSPILRIRVQGECSPVCLF